MDLRPERRMMSMTFLSLLIHVIGSLETAANLICAREFENKRLIWPEKSTNITHNVQSRFWYKGEILVSWVNELGFKEGKDYEGRLRHVGDGNIEIKNVTRNDSGIYQSTSQFRGVSNTSTASVNLQVIGAPANTCKPVISHEGSNLKANLPSVDVCTTSQLRLEWIGTNKTVTTQNGTTILDLGTDSGGREYMVCAVGEATKCFQGNVSDFCTNYTVPQHQQSGDEVKLDPAAVAIPITLIVIAIVVIIIFCVLRHKGIICKKSSRKMDEEQKLGFPLIPKSTVLAIEQELGDQSTQAQIDASTNARTEDDDRARLAEILHGWQKKRHHRRNSAQTDDDDRARLAQTEDDDRARLVQRINECQERILRLMISAQTEDDDRARLAQTEDDDRARLVQGLNEGHEILLRLIDSAFAVKQTPTSVPTTTNGSLATASASTPSTTTGSTSCPTPNSTTAVVMQTPSSGSTTDIMQASASGSKLSTTNGFTPCPNYASTTVDVKQCPTLASTTDKRSPSSGSTTNAMLTSASEFTSANVMQTPTSASTTDIMQSSPSGSTVNVMQTPASGSSAADILKSSSLLQPQASSSIPSTTVDVKQASSVSDCDRFMHIARLLLDVASMVLRRLLHFHTVTPTCTLNQYLDNKKKDINNLWGLRKLNKSQMDILFPKGASTNLGDYDITLLSVLFTNIIPNISEQQLNMIKFLRDQRNRLSHANSATVKSNDYQTLWNDICRTLEALSKLCDDPDFDNEISRKIKEIQVSTIQSTSSLDTPQTLLGRVETLERLVQGLISSQAQKSNQESDDIDLNISIRYQGKIKQHRKPMDIIMETGDSVHM